MARASERLTKQPLATDPMVMDPHDTARTASPAPPDASLMPRCSGTTIALRTLRNRAHQARPSPVTMRMVSAPCDSALRVLLLHPILLLPVLLLPNAPLLLLPPRCVPRHLTTDRCSLPNITGYKPRKTSNLALIVSGPWNQITGSHTPEASLTS